MKKILALMLVLLMLFAFISCGEEKKCEEHTDEDYDYFCDVCGEVVDHDLYPGGGIIGPLVPAPSN